jgi:hypothetical protein
MSMFLFGFGAAMLALLFLILLVGYLTSQRASDQEIVCGLGLTCYVVAAACALLGSVL